MIPYLVSEFEKQTISNLVTECFGSDFPDIFRKAQVGYIFNYLETLNAASVLLELNYIDKDYLEDFSRYYVKRYGNNGHQCARMHFFSQAVDHRQINRILEGEEGTDALVKELDDAYLGFMVIKPLPKTFIGKTCLKVMSDIHDQPGKEKRRLSRSYRVDLFGIELNVQSIAFQEQDKVVAACATTAIWSALHCLKWRDAKSIHSCSEITQNAINHIDGSSNSFPNKELSNKQILRSLDVEGLRHHSEDLALMTQDAFLTTVIGHIDSHLPLLVMGEVFRVEGGDRNLVSYSARHAITIIGYKVENNESVVYVHDDRLGPYARAKLVSLDAYKSEMHFVETWALGLQRLSADKQSWDDPHELIVPEFLAIPADKKARLPFYYANFTAQIIQIEFKEICNAIAPNASLPHLTYDITLREISSIRQEVRGYVAPREYTDPTTGQVHHLEQDDYAQWQRDKIRFLTSGFARLQWQIQFSLAGQKAFRVLIDASDIPQGDAVSAVFEDNVLLSKPILDLFRGRGSFTSADTAPGHFYESFLRNLRVKEQTHMEYLDETYGALRAPIKLKEQEFTGGDIYTNPTRQVLYDSPQKPLRELNQEFSDPSVQYLIWAISRDGALLVGKEIENEAGLKLGHPCITKFRPARIAGELLKSGDEWLINSKSGRYSGDYDQVDRLLTNALQKFQTFFPQDIFRISQPDSSVEAIQGVPA
ncbi:hypothetical protein AXW93_03715 [Pseudomonas aeruginosa]|nr:hypothetical protein AXW93_03715 [Pseudomonas aeruginosa]